MIENFVKMCSCFSETVKVAEMYIKRKEKIDFKCFSSVFLLHSLADSNRKAAVD